MSAEGMLVIDEAGWCLQATRLCSPNWDARPEGMPVDLLVIHNISLPPGEFGTPYIADLFLNRLNCDLHPYFERLRALRVSTHFFISRTGNLIQFVSCIDRAWHAGLSSFQGRERCNDFSIGVELEGDDETPFTDTQYAQLSQLTRSLCAVYPIRHVSGHEHIAPARKTDPGPCFNWTRYAEALVELGSPSLTFPVALD